MYPKQVAFLIREDAEQRREREWQELLHRPDAEPLPPEPVPAPTVGMATRLRAAAHAFLDPLPVERRLRERLDDDARPI